MGKRHRNKIQLLSWPGWGLFCSFILIQDPQDVYSLNSSEPPLHLASGFNFNYHVVLYLSRNPFILGEGVHFYSWTMFECDFRFSLFIRSFIPVGLYLLSTCTVGDLEVSTNVAMSWPWSRNFPRCWVKILQSFLGCKFQFYRNLPGFDHKWNNNGFQTRRSNQLDNQRENWHRGMWSSRSRSSFHLRVSCVGGNLRRS